MAGVQLIVTPMRLSFQAPCDQSQKRLVTLLNPSDQDVMYRIQLDNDAYYEVFPMRGYVRAFDTTELTVTLSPFIQDLPPCYLAVKSISEAVLKNEETCMTEWNCTEVQIELDPKKTPRPADETLGMRLQPEDIAEMILKQYQPGGCQVTQEKPKPPKSKLKRFLYVLGISAVIVGAYFVYVTDYLSLKSERIF